MNKSGGIGGQKSDMAESGVGLASRTWECHVESGIGGMESKLGGSRVE
jgi:hypothetical protein